MEKMLDTGGGNPQYGGRASCCLPLDRSSSHPHAGIVCEEHPVSEQTNGMNGTNGTKVSMEMDLDREVIRCKTCGLVQYRTRTGNCRRCVRALPQRLEFLIPQAAPEEEAVAEVVSDTFANQETVENIGQRIRQLRESRTMT